METQKPVQIYPVSLCTFCLLNPLPQTQNYLLTCVSTVGQCGSPGAECPGLRPLPFPLGVRPDQWTLRFLVGQNALETRSQACLPPQGSCPAGTENDEHTEMLGEMLGILFLLTFGQPQRIVMLRVEGKATDFF